MASDLFAEIRRREAMTGLHGAIGALYDQLARQDIIPADRMLTYLTYRLKREESMVAGLPAAEASAEVWQRKIDQMDQATA